MAEAARLSVGLTADTSQLEAGLSKAHGLVSGFGGVMSKVGGIAFTGAIAGIGGLGAALGGSVAAAAGFEKTMSAVGAVSGATAEQMKSLSSTALQIGKDTQFGAAEAAAGIEELVKAGVSIEDVLGGAAAATANLAAATGTDLKTAAEIASGAMNNFGKTGADMTDVVNTISGAVNASAIDINDFKFSLASVGAVANTMGITLEDTSVAIAAMGQAGIKGSDAGTSLKTMFLNLIPDTDKARATMQDLGLFTVDAAGAMNQLTLTLKDSAAGRAALAKAEKAGTVNGKELFALIQKINPEAARGAKNFEAYAQKAGLTQNAFFDMNGAVKPMAQVFDELAKATAGLTKEQQISAIQIIFGTDAVRAAAIAARLGAGGFEEMAAQMKLQGDAAKIAKERLNNLAGSFEQMKGSIETAAITIGLAMTPALKAIVDGATGLINNAMPAIEEFGKRAAAAIVGVQAAASGLGKFLRTGSQDDLAYFSAGLANIVPADAIPSILRFTSELQEKFLPAISAAFSGDLSPIAGLLQQKLAEQWARIDWSGLWQKAGDLAGGLVSALGALGVNVQTGLRTAWSLIDWNAVWAGATTTAVGLAASLSGLASEAQRVIGEQWAQIDWNAIWGQAQGFAQGLATGLSAQLATVDWGATGAAIGTGIIGAIDTALTVGDQLGARLLTIVGSALSQVNWGQLGKDAAPGALAFVIEFSNALLDPAVWFKVITEHWDAVLLLAVSIIAAPAKWLSALSKVPIVGPILSWLALEFQGVARGILGVIATHVDEMARLFVTSFGDSIGLQGIGAILPRLVTVIDNVVAGALAMRTKFFDTAATFMIDMGAAVAEHGPVQIVNGLRTILDLAVAIGREFIPIFRVMGDDLVIGLGDGIRAGIGLIQGIVRGLADAAVAAAKAAFGIASPSTVFMAIGQDMVAGLQAGFTSSIDAFLGTLRTKLEEAKNLASQILTSAPSAVGNAVGGAASAVGGAIRGAASAVGNAAGFVKNNVGQFGIGLPAGQAMAACGPYAAMVFANAVGRYPTAAEAIQLARSVGWTEGSGMAGPGSEVNLLGKMGVNAVQQSATYANASAAIQAGGPVAFSTPKHYFAATAVDEAGRFNVGGTGTALRGGKEWMTIEEMTALGGGMQSIIVLAGQMGDAVALAGLKSAPAILAIAQPVEKAKTGFEAIWDAVANGRTPLATLQTQLVGLASTAGFEGAASEAMLMASGVETSEIALRNVADAMAEANPQIKDWLHQLRTGQIDASEFALRLLQVFKAMQQVGGATAAAVDGVAAAGAALQKAAAVTTAAVDGIAAAGAAMSAVPNSAASAGKGYIDQFKNQGRQGAPLPNFGGIDPDSIVKLWTPLTDAIPQLFQNPTFQGPQFTDATVGMMNVAAIQLPGQEGEGGLGIPGVGAAGEQLGALGGAGSAAAEAVGALGSEASKARGYVSGLGGSARDAEDALRDVRNAASDAVDAINEFVAALATGGTAARTGA